MGQYHSLVNIDKKEIVNPHGLGLGAKQYEHLNLQGSLSDALYLLLMTSPCRGGGDLPATPMSGYWAGDRVLVYGDYTQESDVPFIAKGENPENSYTDITETLAISMEIAFRVKSHGEGWKKREVLETI
jgi:hypothetical protein